MSTFKSGLLLLSISLNHFVLILFHLSLAFQKCPLLIHGQDHVGLRLLSLLHVDTRHFIVFIDHTLNNLVNLLALALILSTSLFPELSIQLNLFLNVLLVLLQLHQHFHFFLALFLLADFVVPEHHHVDTCFVFLTSHGQR